MESVDVKCCLKTPVEHKTVNLDNVESISDFRALLSVYFDIEPYSFDMVHLGTRIKDEQLLSQLGLKKGSVVFILKSSKKVLPSGESSYLTTFNSAANPLKQILSSKLARNIVATKLQHQKLLELVIKAVPEFGYDPIAMSIVTSKDLLWTFLNAPDKQSVLNEHPSLAKAVMFLNEALKNEDLGKRSDVQDGRALYNIDHMSEDEDDEQPIRGNTARGPQRNVEMSELANFFNMRPPASQPGRPDASGQPLITRDFLRQAMMMAANQGGNMPSQPLAQSPMAAPQQGPILGEEDMESKLQQLREMGITDEAVARSALLQTGGNIQLALEILFEGDM